MPIQFSWKQSQLWSKLADRSPDRSLVLAIEAALDTAESVLSSSSTGPIDFTLHDADHSFRVAERMSELISGEVESNLNNYELSLLLLSAYLHDIGMSPGRELVGRHHRYILTSDSDLLSPTEATEFRRYLDSAWPDVLIPLAATALSDSDLLKAEEISAYYTRYKHNDWSEEWIRGNLPVLSSTPYPDWVDDIVTLCRSHHEGLTELRSKRFDARLVGSISEVINLRFLAAILRVADVLEFDPERTPSVILQHRSIAARSRIFWYKDHTIGITISGQTRTIMLSGRTPNARVHKAVLETFEQVNTELNLCSAMSNAGLFTTGIMLPEDRSRYAWPWPSQILQDVSEKDDSFVYIDGSFRPNTKKLLQLLSGTQLYRTSYAALRELIQNAVDAVKEQIARERLLQSHPEDPALSHTIGSLHRIRVSFEKEADRFWLRCTDDGVGMTKALIANRLLVSGADRSPDLIALERSCNASGFSVGRTGQFGIGTLSYFMLADHVEITTRRSSEAGDGDNSAWRFSTDGIADFGELLKVSRASKGTEVRLRLSDSWLPEGGFQEIAQYILKTVRRLPCPLEIRDATTSEPPIILPMGWTASGASLQPALSSPTAATKDGLRTKEAEVARLRLEQSWAAVVEKANTVARVYGPTEHALTGVQGNARVWLRYFDIGGQPSLAFIDEVEDIVNSLPDKTDVRVPPFAANISYNGFLVENSISLAGPFVVEIDVTGGAKISVDRISLEIDHLALTAEVKAICTSLVERFLAGVRHSKFHTLNRTIAYQFTGELIRDNFEEHPPVWAMRTSSGKSIKTCQFPLVDLLQKRAVPRTLALVEDQKFALTDKLAVDGEPTGLALCRTVEGGRLAFVAGVENWLPVQPAIIWDSIDRLNDLPLYCTSFPPYMDNFVYVSTGYGGLYNANNALVSMIGTDQIERRRIEFDPASVELSKLDKHSSAIILCAYLYRDQDFWNAIRDNRPDEYSAIMTYGGVTEDRPLFAIHTDHVTSSSGIGVVRLGPKGASLVTRGHIDALDENLASSFPWLKHTDELLKYKVHDNGHVAH